MAEQHTVNPTQQTRQVTPESGLRYDRLFFTRELDVGETPTNPDWLRFSDLVMEADADPDPGKEAVHGVGTGDPVYFGRGTEENGLDITYGLQKPVVETNGDPLDACADAFLRNMAWQTPSTHSFYARHNNPTPGRDDPDGCAGQRLYFVGRGGKPNCTLEPDAEDEEPVPVSLEYSFERIRSYHIWQPEEPSAVAVRSTDDRDAVDVTIESTDGIQSETLALDGDSPVGGSVAFEDIDSISLSEPTYGDVRVHLNDGDEAAPDAGSLLSQLLGADTRAQGTASTTRDGDRGIPPIGSGSYEGAVARDFEDIQDDEFIFETFPDDAPLPEIYNITVEADNNFENSPRQGTSSPQINEENRNVEIEASIIGERASHDILQSAYTSESGDITWTMSYTRFIMPDAECIEPPGPGAENEQAFVEIEGTWASRGIIIENIENE